MSETLIDRLFLRSILSLTWNTKIKILQAMCWIGGPLVLIFQWDTNLFLASWAWGWFVGGLGLSVTMHRCFSHRAWQPRNQLINSIIHFFAVINVMGSSITWTGTHRMHHKHCDRDGDPHNVCDKDLLTRIKYWFNYWPSHRVEPDLVKDLIRDPMHKWFHRHYFKVLTLWATVLLAIDVQAFLYFFVVSTMFTLHTTSWITVGAHIWGKHQHDTDSSRNTWIMGTYIWGEGWHSNHHAKPWSFEFGWHAWQPDIGKWVIRLLAKPESLHYAT